EPPFDHPKKQENINATVSILEETIGEIITSPVNVIPVRAYIDFEDGQIAYDRRWNIDTLLDYLITELLKEAQVILANLSKVKAPQTKLARNVGKSVMTGTGVVGAAPIPVADMPVITGLQLSMVGTIAMISGRKMNQKTIVQFLGAM